LAFRDEGTESGVLLERGRGGLFIELFLPNLKLHLIAFVLVLVDGSDRAGLKGGVGIGDMDVGSFELWEFNKSELGLYSVAGECKPEVRLFGVLGFGENGEFGGTDEPLPLRAPRFRRLDFDSDIVLLVSDFVQSTSASTPPSTRTACPHFSSFGILSSKGVLSGGE
jgi:hypothetical protein